MLIDGLDEFQESVEDHNDLVRTLQNWLSKAAGKEKFCVSSREHDAFSVFPEDQRISLHKLTETDIRTVVLGRLGSHPRFPQPMNPRIPTPGGFGDVSGTDRAHQNEFQAYGLINDIVSKAEGVFLWVDLLLRDLRKCLAGGFSISRIRGQG